MEETRRQPTEQDLIWLIEKAYEWILDQRNEDRAALDTLPDHVHPLFDRFFDPPTLAKMKIRKVLDIRLPSFAPEAAARGMPLDFIRDAAALTLKDTVLISLAACGRTVPRFFADPRVWIWLLFHELVHIVQYDLLGFDEFVNQYVRGVAAVGFIPAAIRTTPLEQIAYDLQDRFVADSQTPISVRDELRQFLGV